MAGRSTLGNQVSESEGSVDVIQELTLYLPNN